MHIRGLGEIAPVIPAPMSGYGDRAWREMARRMGCRLVVVPLVSAEGLARGQPMTCALVDIEGERPPVSVQLFGMGPEALAEAARKIEAMGAAAVDLNLGCPARRVVQGGSGAAVLKDPRLLARIVAAMRESISIPLTVKMRAGWDEDGASPAELARIVESEGADAIAVHARTGRQQFKGQANWHWIGAVKQAVAIAVIGNGDVRSGEDALRMQRQTECDGVMIGRAAIGNPWLLREALAWLAAGGQPAQSPNSPGPSERLEMLLEHARLMTHYRGEPRGVVEFRKHAIRYIKGLPESKSLKQALMAASALDQVTEAVVAYCRQVLGFDVTG